jgi:hypothetical protein
MTTIVMMTARTSATGTSADTTGCRDRNPLGLLAGGFAPDLAAVRAVDGVDGWRRVDGARRLVGFDIWFS